MQIRKALFFLACLGLALCMCAAASADAVSFGSIGASCELPERYTLLEAGYLDEKEAWLTGHGYTVEALEAEFSERGVIAQAWSPDADICVEIRATWDEEATRIQDIDSITASERNTYRLGYLKNRTGKDEGYTWDYAQWKKTKQGRFLVLRYRRTTSEGSYAGYARRTIKNGYTLTIDYQVYGRKTKAADNTALTKIMNTWIFSAAYTPKTPAPSDTAPAGEGETAEGDQPAVTGPIAATVFETLPPAETSTGEFSVKGVGTPGLTIVGTLMRMSSLEPVQVQTVIGRSGKFTLPVKLATEGVWLMTATVYNGNVMVEEKVFNTTTYQNSLLIINFDSDLPTQLVSDTLTISGTTMGQTTVQCLVTSPTGTSNYSKQIRTNNSGKFSFKITTREEGEYIITIVFSKKHYTTRRYSVNAGRSLTQEDLNERAVSEAIKPSYSTLKSKIESYTGRTMTYNLYITDVVEANGKWAVFGAMRYSKTKGYRDMVVILCDEKPDFETGSQHRMYGTCAGTYLVQDSVSGDQYYPCFNLLMWAK